MARTLLITGTDTGVGKTVVSEVLVAAARARGLETRAYKPVETGCLEEDGTRYGLDCRRLAAASGQTAAEVAGYLFASPVAPMVAAAAEGVRIEPERLRADLARVSDGADLVLLEGAGGLLVPITETLSYRELARQLGLPVVLVVASKLGCVNHSLLTLDVLDQAGIEVVGYVINQGAGAAADDVSTQSNRETIAALSHHRELGVLPKLEPALAGDQVALARTAEDRLDLETILGN